MGSIIELIVCYGAASSMIELVKRPPTTSTSWLPVAAVLLGAGWASNQFTPLLLVYHRTLGLETGTLTAIYGVYALGLIPGLLVAGPLSDARGRRPVALPAAAVSLAASLVLIAGHSSVPLLFAGRFLVGVSTGAAFGAGTAWLREVSLPPLGTANTEAVARRTAVAMTAGFGLGPLLAGLLAQWAPEPAIVPYLPHVLLMAVVLLFLLGVPETVAARTGAIRFSTAGVRNPRFRRVVAPMAPWVFAAPAVAFAFLPSVVDAGDATDGIAATAAVTALTALCGVLIQPLGRRLGADGGSRVAVAGLLVVAAGMGLAALAADADRLWLLFPGAIVLGAAYGLCLVAGLTEVQRIAAEDEVGALTAVFYALTYLGFATPFLLTVLNGVAGYPILLLATGALALMTATVVSREPAAAGMARESEESGINPAG